MPYRRIPLPRYNSTKDINLVEYSTPQKPFPIPMRYPNQVHADVRTWRSSRKEQGNDTARKLILWVASSSIARFN